MTAFKNLRIGARLGLGFALLILAAVAIALFARLSLVQVNAEFKLLVEDRVAKVSQLETIKDNINQLARVVRNVVLLTDTAKMTQEVQRIEAVSKATAEMLAKLEPTLRTEKGIALFKAIMDKQAPYMASADRVTQLGLADRNDDATTLLMGETRQAQNDYLEAVQATIDFQKQLMTESAASVDAAVAQAGMLMVVAALVAGVAGAALAWYITQSITTPIRRAVQVAETVAGGDLRSDIVVDSRDETGQLLGALKRMNEALVKTVTAVRGNADSVATASSQIAQGNVDLSQRTEEQASNLQQTAASMEELTATVKQNADTARQASQLATSASSVAGRGGDVVGRVVATMEDISASSKKIADIIGTIDGIAFQTNILALNAAVEAARAGEQGRGFAVVAGEVRSLAQRSAEAAKEIKSLIGASVERVEAGTALVGEAGTTMDEIVGQVRRVSDLLGEISAASIEQTQGIGQVGDAVQQLDQVTQQNAALVEESAAAAESLKLQAVQLAQAVAFFSLHDGATAVRPVVAAVPAAPAAPKPAQAAAAALRKAASPPAAKAAPAVVAPRAPRAPATPALKPAPVASGADDDWTSF